MNQYVEDALTILVIIAVVFTSATIESWPIWSWPIWG